MSTKKILGLFLVALMGGAAALGLSSLIKKESRLTSSVGPSIPVRQVGFSPIAGNLPDFETAASISIHAVVHIKTEFLRKITHLHLKYVAV